MWGLITHPRVSLWQIGTFTACEKIYGGRWLTHKILSFEYHYEHHQLRMIAFVDDMKNAPLLLGILFINAGGRREWSMEKWWAARMHMLHHFLKFFQTLWIQFILLDFYFQPMFFEKDNNARQENNNELNQTNSPPRIGKAIGDTELQKQDEWWEA